MPARHIRVRPTAAVVAPILDAIRAELAVPDEFPPAVEAEATAAVTRGPLLPVGATGEVDDRRELPLITIDPAGARDLDQAYAAARRAGSGYRVHYAIADVNAFVRPGGALDVESHRRGVTLYQPDRRTPLYPEVLGQAAASLLAGEDRRSLLWTIDLDADGSVVGEPRLRRALVRSRAALSYTEAQQRIDSGGANLGGSSGADDPLLLLREIGLLREQQEDERDGVSLQLPSQEVLLGDGQVRLAFDVSLPVEGWNAQISLLAGMVAASIMIEGRIGVIRTLPPPDEEALANLRTRAAALGIEWPTSLTYPQFVHSLDPATPTGAALLNTAARALRGAGYTAFDGTVPPHPRHAAVASTYAHVTAPLRRLVDRYANEVVLSVCQGGRPPSWVVEALPQLPADMAAASRRERDLERAIVDGVEAFMLKPHVGEVFEGVVIGDSGRNRLTVQLNDPAVVGHLELDEGTGGEIGQPVRVRLQEADPVARVVRFVPV